MASPLFSVITVTLNPGAQLGHTVRSVAAQRFRNFEHLIKDAGSTDGSVQQYARSIAGYEPIVIRQADEGIYDGMNQALAHARGKYVLFLNAGDTLYNENVLGQVAVVADSEPDVHLIYGDYFAGWLRCVVRSPKRLTRFALYRNTLCHQSCFVRRDQLSASGGFDTCLRVLADYDLLLRMMLSADASCHYIDEPLSWCLGGGFSAMPINAAIGRREAKLLRHRHFELMDRLLYECARAATCPSLRIRLMASRHLTGLQRLYTRVANVWNG